MARNDITTLLTFEHYWPAGKQEQKEILKSYQENFDRQSKIWRDVFQWLFCFCMSILAYQQFMKPWELSYHAYFKDQVDSIVVAFIDGMAFVACGLAFYSFSCACQLYKTRNFLLWSSFLCIMVAIFWLYHMIRLAKFCWDIIWLPVGPPCCSLVSLYVTHLLAESQDAIHKLQANTQ